MNDPSSFPADCDISHLRGYLTSEESALLVNPDSLKDLLGLLDLSMQNLQDMLTESENR